MQWEFPSGNAEVSAQVYEEGAPVLADSALPQAMNLHLCVCCSGDKQSNGSHCKLWCAFLTTGSRPCTTGGYSFSLPPHSYQGMVKTLHVCTIQNHCVSTQIPSRQQWVCIWIKALGPGQSWLPPARARELLPSQPATWEPFFPLMISALQQEGSLNLTRKVFEVLPKPDLY